MFGICSIAMFDDRESSQFSGYPRYRIIGRLQAVPGRCFEKESVLPIYVSVPSFPEAAPRASRCSWKGPSLISFAGHDEGK